MHPLEHHTLHRLQESEQVRRAERVRQARERDAAGPRVPATAGPSWLRLPRLAVRGRRPA
ncbi:hypothetical protein BCL65_10850 [Isoptericola halotolerans]|uniref:Uncharacterized protein n=1 Tax=Isoptericola halotolerans TaxID=300560 RepID=A0ABX5EEL8_9MICO|nr:hypothetical protein BCL65_10850 [Isoptericola halotolerans]